MKIALIGASGFIGNDLLKEALSRGHQVTALLRHPEKIPKHALLVGKAADIFQTLELGQLLEGHDAVISAYNPGHGDADLRANLGKGTQSIIDAVKRAGIKRLLVVGGAGSLEVSPGIQLVDTPEFPAQWKAGALGSRDALALVKKETGLDWSFLSPSALIEPGKRTGTFRLGTDQLLVDDKDESRISTQDFAVAMLNELEQPKHIRQRFTVGY